VYVWLVAKSAVRKVTKPPALGSRGVFRFGLWTTYTHTNTHKCTHTHFYLTHTHTKGHGHSLPVQFLNFFGWIKISHSDLENLRMRLLCILLALISIGSSYAIECDSDGNCDKNERCVAWIAEGECFLNEEYMRQECPVSCKAEFDKLPPAKANECRDYHQLCSKWVMQGECGSNSNVSKYCPKTCGDCRPSKEEIEVMIGQTFGGQKDSAAPIEKCEDKHEKCSAWAMHLGDGLYHEKSECSNTWEFMNENCQESCGICSLLTQTESFGTRQVAKSTNPQELKNIINVLQKSIDYMKDKKTLALPKDVLENCVNRKELCSFWAVRTYTHSLHYLCGSLAHSPFCVCFCFSPLASVRETQCLCLNSARQPVETAVAMMMMRVKKPVLRTVFTGR
jgi:hypothetical protein